MEMICQILHKGLEKRKICMKCVPQSHRWSHGTQSQIIKTSSRHVRPFQSFFVLFLLEMNLGHFHMNPKQNVIAWSRDIQKLLLAKIKDQNEFVVVVFFCFEKVTWSTRHACQKEKQETVNSTYTCWKGYCSRFKEWGWNFERMILGSFCMTMPLLVLP